MKNTLGFDTSKFSKSVSEILEHDYGDFMRVANLYLINLREELDLLKDSNIESRLDLMQLYLQYYPNWDIELTRNKLTQDTKYLDEILQGHAQDWESARRVEYI